MTMVDIAALGIAALACATDLRSRRIPNWLTLGAMVTGVCFHAIVPGGSGFAPAAFGLVVGLLVFFPFFALGALGAGDVKLMAALGAWVGAAAVVNVALYGAVAGGVLAVIVAVSRSYLPRALRNLRTLFTHWWLVGIKPLPELTLDKGQGPRLPYALPIMAGLVVALWRS
jgi:prepilin peptidase CpaA